MTNVDLQPKFRPFNPKGEFRLYVRNLPHWRQPGATYFVTFRQDDSIPQAVLAEWQDLRNRWYKANGLDPELKTSDSERFDSAYAAIPLGVRRAFEREQSKMLHDELDRCHGSCVLSEEDPRHQVKDSIAFFHGQRWWTGDFVVMPNHAHSLVVPFDKWKLEDLLGSVKKFPQDALEIG